MLFEQMNWYGVENYLKTDNRVVLVLCATEEHADLSICTDTMIPYQLAVKACVDRLAHKAHILEISRAKGGRFEETIAWLEEAKQ